MSNPTECKDCGHTVSKRAAICPSCGVSFPGRVQPQILVQTWKSLTHIPYLRLLKKAARIGAFAGLGASVFFLLLFFASYEERVGDDLIGVPAAGIYAFGFTAAIVWVGLIVRDLVRHIAELRERH